MVTGDRRGWLFPDVPPHVDPADEDGRRQLVEADHPDLAAAIAGDLDEVEVDGEPMNPRLHLLLHQLVANQIWHDDPPEMWQAARRLAAAGYDRHEVLHMLASVLAGEVWEVMRHEKPFDRERLREGLAALPDSWEEERMALDPGPPAGTTLTHRLSPEEAAGGFVCWSPDLQPLGPLIDWDGRLPLVGGGHADQTWDDGGRCLAGTPGWLGPARAGDLVGFRVTAGAVEVVGPAGLRPQAPGSWCDLLADVFDAANEGDGMPVTVAELVNGVLERLPGPPLTLPPAGELLEGCGYEVRDDYAAPQGADWDAFERLQAAVRAGGAHGLSIGDTHALAAICQLYRLFAAGRLDADGPADAELWAEVAGVITDPDAGPAFLDVVLGEGGPALPEAAAGVEPFLAAAERHAGRRHGPGLAWARSLVARRAGDHDRAEAALRAALAGDPGHAEALWDAAWYASDRGDARRAMALLARLAEEGDDDAEDRMGSLRRFANPPTPLAGRNDPCPCGSGRKHKHCCLGLPRHSPLPDRVGWVWEKLDWFLRVGGFEDDVEEVLDMLGNEPMDELLAVSLVLFQDGAVDEFLLQRGPLLPDDERNLVAQWALRERSVHEVAEVRRGEGFTLRDVRTGDVHEVRERRGSTQVVPGDLICAHVVPDGHTNQLVGGLIVVPLWLRDPLMSVLDAEPTALELAALIARSAAPPELFNTEGEAMVLCETRYRLPDPSALAGLDRVLDADGEGTWTESVEVDGRTWLRGSVTLSGEELVVGTNSRERSRRLRATVEAAVPGLRVVSEEETPAADVMSRRDRSAAGPGAGPALAPVPPEAADMLAAFMREQEERWVDEPVPALAGLTPRQAAADPTRRQQLEALLHDFDRQRPPPGAATFDTARLRSLLGL